MRSTALPLRVMPDGRLEQGDDLDALLELVKAMSLTSAATWPHAPWFGLLELFEESARQRRQDYDTLKDALNLAFERLGADWARVDSVSAAETDNPGWGRHGFRLAIQVRGDQMLYPTVDVG